MSTIYNCYVGPLWCLFRAFDFLCMVALKSVLAMKLGGKHMKSTLNCVAPCALKIIFLSGIYNLHMRLCGACLAPPDSAFLSLPASIVRRPASTGRIPVQGPGHSGDAMSEGLAAQLLGSRDASPVAQIPKNPLAVSLPSSTSTQSPAASILGKPRST
jgi:hypothetical protein